MSSFDRSCESICALGLCVQYGLIVCVFCVCGLGWFSVFGWVRK